MVYALNDGGGRIMARRGARGSCPGCGDELIPKCGAINVHHWAHRVGDCDPWYEPESAWHLAWKSLVRPEVTEVVVGPHRADIVGNGGMVIELQHSFLSSEEIGERERFYGEMIWLVDAGPFKERLGEIEVRTARDGTQVLYSRWSHPRKTWIDAEKPLFFDIRPRGIMRVLSFVRIDGRWSLRGKWISAQRFHQSYLSEVMAAQEQAA